MPLIEGDIYVQGDEKFCHKCQQWLPATSEFFYPQKNGDGPRTLNSPCKACNAESRYKLTGKKCIVEGCDQPRRTHRTPRCQQHNLEHERARRALKQESARA